jgi:lysine biosynthesis protein LysW
MKNAECLICGEFIEIGLKLKYGQRLHCPACNAVLEVVDLDPIKLDWLYFDKNIQDGALNKEQNDSVECPVCQHNFFIPQNIILGQCILCPACYVDLEVVWLNPLELSRSYGDGHQIVNPGYRGSVSYLVNNE